MPDALGSHVLQEVTSLGNKVVIAFVLLPKVPNFNDKVIVNECVAC